MKIINMEIESFLTVGSMKVRLDDRGLVLVQGDNRDDTSQDSNGAGKSSLADAVSWALFGVTARGESGNDVINNTVKRGGAKVLVEINDDGTRYKIERTRQKGKGSLDIWRKDGTTWAPLTRGTIKLTQSLLEKIIGCSADVFNNAIYAGQEKMPDLPGMTDKMLKMLIEEAAGILRIERAYKVARDKFNDTQKQIERQTRTVENAEYILDLGAKAITRLIEQAQDWEKTHKIDLRDQVAKLTGCKKELDEAVTKHKRLSAGEAGLKSERDAIDKRLSEVDKYHKAVTDAERAASNAKHALSMVEVQLANAARDARATKTKLESIDDIVGKPCDSCGKPYSDDDIEPRRVKLRKTLQDELDSLKTLKQDKSDAEKKLSETRGSVDKAKDEVPNTSAELTRRDELTDALNAIALAEREVSAATTQVRSQMTHVKGLKAQSNPHQSSLDSEKAQQVLHKDALKKERQRLETLEMDLELRRAAAQVFGPAGVRAHILDTVTPFLNDRTNGYLSALTDGNVSAYWSTIETNAKGEIKEKFAIAVSSKVGAHSFKGLSGGEKRKVRLACSMALQDLVSSRATKPIQLYIADEIDHALDEAGLERLMAILEDKASDRGTVLVISHNSISDWCRQNVTIVKEGGKSRIEGSALS